MLTFAVANGNETRGQTGFSNSPPVGTSHSELVFTTLSNIAHCVEMMMLIDKESIGITIMNNVTLLDVPSYWLSRWAETRPLAIQSEDPFLHDSMTKSSGAFLALCFDVVQRILILLFLLISTFGLSGETGRSSIKM